MLHYFTWYVIMVYKCDQDLRQNVRSINKTLKRANKTLDNERVETTRLFDQLTEELHNGVQDSNMKLLRSLYGLSDMTSLQSTVEVQKSCEQSGFLGVNYVLEKTLSIIDKYAPYFKANHKPEST